MIDYKRFENESEEELIYKKSENIRHFNHVRFMSKEKGKNYTIVLN